MHKTWESAVLVAVALLTASGGAAQASGYAVIYSFKGGADGASPNGVTLGANGALYGTTHTGGLNTCGVNTFFLCGTVFELAPVGNGAWAKTVLLNFNGVDGALPSQSLAAGPGPRAIFGSNGTLYGVTTAGGSNDSTGSGFGGTVFELAPPAAEAQPGPKVCCIASPPYAEAPHTPVGGLLVGPSGAIYGTTLYDFLVEGYETGGTVF